MRVVNNVYHLKITISNVPRTRKGSYGEREGEPYTIYQARRSYMTDFRKVGSIIISSVPYIFK